MNKIYFNKKINIDQNILSEDSSVFIIAEAGVNHNGDMHKAKEMIDVAVEVGVDAVKFQFFKTENLILKNVPKALYQKQTTEKNESQFEMLKKLEITYQNNVILKQYCDEKGVTFLTTPFDEESLSSLDTLNVSAYKVASTDITNIPFLNKIAKKNKPIFISTGMAYLDEIKIALDEIRQYNSDIILMQCTANYPINNEEVNLNVINTFKDNFDVLLGYSDHTEGVGAAPYSIPMGVKVIEKHFTLDKKLDGPDHKASLDPVELKQLVDSVRQVEQFMGETEKVPTLREVQTRKSLQKCLVASKEIRKGDYFTDYNIIAKRTGGVGISPIYYHDVIGKKANREYSIDQIIEL